MGVRTFIENINNNAKPVKSSYSLDDDCGRFRLGEKTNLCRRNKSGKMPFAGEDLRNKYRSPTNLWKAQAPMGQPKGNLSGL